MTRSARSSRRRVSSRRSRSPLRSGCLSRRPCFISLRKHGKRQADSARRPGCESGCRARVSGAGFYGRTAVGISLQQRVTPRTGNRAYRRCVPADAGSGNPARDANGRALSDAGAPHVDQRHSGAARAFRASRQPVPAGFALQTQYVARTRLAALGMSRGPAGQADARRANKKGSIRDWPTPVYPQPCRPKRHRNSPFAKKSLSRQLNRSPHTACMEPSSASGS